MMQLRQQFVYYRKVMFLHMSVCSQGGCAYRWGACIHMGDCLQKGVLFIQRGGICLQRAKGSTYGGWTDPSPRPENWGLRILMECFLIATNILHGIHDLEIAPFEFLYWV